MNYAEKGLKMSDGKGTVPASASEILWGALSEIIREGRFPILLRDTIQFYLKHIAVFKARVLDNNRITIPKEEVEILGINPGDYVAVILTKIESSGVRPK